MANTLIGSALPGTAEPDRPGPPDTRTRPGRLLTRRSSRRSRLGPEWPLVIMISLFPVWWLLGLSQILVLFLAIPMVLQLIARRSIVVPRGFGWWMIFLFWIVAGFVTLFADAPHGIPGGAPNRIPTYLYRLAWYAAITVVFLWIGNLDERSLPTRRVIRMIAWMFFFTTFGGLLGLIAPHLELTSLMQQILPKSLTSVDFVKSMIQPKTADIQSVLGPDLARPTAPFAYSNTWGSVIGLTLPFFLIGWLGPDAGWRRRVAPVVLVLAAIPVIYSLNRGLWLCLALGGVVLAVQLAFSGRVFALVALGATLLVIAGLLAASPLGDLLVERLHNGHSNGRRSQLLTETVKSAAEGSPVAGFGSTRKVQGSFDSIAGGSTPDCHACGVPPLGTQGHIWLVIFSQGLVGTVFFVAFYVSQFARYWRSRTTLQVAGTIVLIFFFVQLFVYDLLGWPMYIVMMAMALMWRERWRSADAPDAVPGSVPGSVPGAALEQAPA